jgi:cysteine desulfurase family protein (TIGR01976 family)
VTTPDLGQVRAQFPALASGFAFFENAGGSQVPVQVLARMKEFMETGYVQTGAQYPAADLADKTVAQAKAFANVLTNGEGVGLTIVGPSTTDLVYRLANSLAHDFSPEDEIVVSVANHESNIGAWVRLGCNVKWWGVDPETGMYDYGELASLLTGRTKVVAVPHTSNILGDILDAQRVCDMAHGVGALAVVDGVAFAPHAAPDVQAIGADFYVLSLYKVYGPHIALLFGTREAWSRVKGPNHYFIEDADLPWKFELGCQPYEALAGLLGVGEYLSFLAGHDEPRFDRATVEAAYSLMGRLERPLTQAIADLLLSMPQVRLLGPRTGDQSLRHPTFSFLHRQAPSDAVVGKVNGPDLGIRYGHMYAARLCEAVGAPPGTGVVRISAVHYNAPYEVERLAESLARAI